MLYSNEGRIFDSGFSSLLSQILTESMAGSLGSMAVAEVAAEAVVAVICIAGNSAAEASYVDMAVGTSQALSMLANL